MELIELKKHFEQFDRNKVFDFGLSAPFSWRGNYSEVCFSIKKEPMSCDLILGMIDIAYQDVFHGYKGGSFRFGDYTTVNFEDSERNYTDGAYVAGIIAEIEKTRSYKSQEERLVNLAFK